MTEKEIKRKCQSCQKITDRKELIKITKLSDGSIVVNPSSKQLGRSVYVCKNEECIKFFIKKKKLKTALKSGNLEQIEKTEKILAEMF